MKAAVGPDPVGGENLPPVGGGAFAAVIRDARDARDEERGYDRIDGFGISRKIIQCLPWCAGGFERILQHFNVGFRGIYVLRQIYIYIYIHI